MTESLTQNSQQITPAETEEEEKMEQYPGRLPTGARRYGNVPTPSNAPSRLPVPQRASALQKRGSDEIQIEEPPPIRLLQRRRHPLLLVGVFLLFLVIGWWLLIQVNAWWQVTQDDWHYGRPRTFQTDEVVGHHDLPANPSHFIVLNLRGHILIYELPGGDASKTEVYVGPTLISQGKDLMPATLKFQDVNGDGKIDMLLIIGDSSLIYINTGTSFKTQSL